MAVTGFWPIYKNLKATLDYADNPDKTTAREYLDDDLYAALSYAENNNKTDRKMILSRLVDTFSSRILYPMRLPSGNYSIAVV